MRSVRGVPAARLVGIGAVVLSVAPTQTDTSRMFVQAAATHLFLVSSVCARVSVYHCLREHSYFVVVHACRLQCVFFYIQ